MTSTSTSVPVRGGAHRRARPRRRITTWLLVLCAVYGVVASLQLLAIALVRDGWVWTYAAALVYFWWLLPAPLLLLLTLAARSWRVAVTLLAPVAVCGYLLGPYLLHDVPGVLPADRADLRVATYNLSNGRPLDGLFALVRDHHPDILLLQEATATSTQLAARVPGYPYVGGGRGASAPGHDSYAVLSRYPVTAITPVAGLPAGARPADVVTVEVAGHRVALISVHLASPCFGCTASDHPVAGYTAQASRVRVAEAQRYADVVRDLRRGGDDVVLAGDLNASPMNQPLGELTSAGLVDAQAAVGRTPGLTRGPGPGIARVDAVLVAGLRPVRAFDGGRGESDHAPVIADLAWPRP